jgi:hypothetical protein
MTTVIGIMCAVMLGAVFLGILAWLVGRSMLSDHSRYDRE